MKLAVCGYPPLAQKFREIMKNNGVEVNFFISDFITERIGRGDNPNVNIPMITFFEFRRLVDAGELDGIVIAEDLRENLTKQFVQLCKLYKIPKVGVMILNRYNPVSPIYWLNTDKACIAILNTNLIDACNLNCKGCTHFSSLFDRNEIYPLENFRRDLQRLSEVADVVSFHLLGGEPLLLKNLDEYVKITRRYFPKTNIRIITNGLLIPTISQAVIDALIETKTVVAVSLYPPTRKILDKLRATLESNKILHEIGDFIESFYVFMTFNGNNDPEKSRKSCIGNDICRFLRGGKIYKCPLDGLSYRFTEKFGIEGYPRSTGVDIYAENFSALLPMLDGNIELCGWCSERVRKFPWQPENKPQIEDWLADPDELKNFQ